LTLLIACTDDVLAQLPGQLPGAVEPGRDRPLPELPPPSNFDFSIQAPERSPVSRAVDEIQFVLRDIRIVGAMTLGPERFRPLYQQLIGQEVTLSAIFGVAEQIEEEYRLAGYILVRAFIPPQRVADGVFTINVVEGFVSGVAVEGGQEGTQERIESYLAPVLDAMPLDLATIERGLLLANDLPGADISGLLRPSPDTPGASELLVTVVSPPITGGFAIDNRGSSYAGLWTIYGDFAVNLPFGADDQIAGSIATSTNPSQRIAGQLRYRRPIGVNGLLASFFATATKGEPGSTLQELNVLTDSWAVGPRLTYPIKRSRAETILIDGGLTIQDARVRILDEPFSHDEWRVIDIGVSYVQTGFLDGAWSATIDVAQGLPVAGATEDGSPDLSRAGATTAFTKIVGALRHSRTLVGSLSMTAALQGQYAFSRLIAGEQIAFGGLQVGRGYEPGAITGDHGLGALVELRYTELFPEGMVTSLQPYAFLDAAETWSREEDESVDQSMTSTGIGVRLSMRYGVSMGVELARTLVAVAGSDGGKQATKVLFDMAVRY
jgi:hemolysin activation/secretion protein